MARISRPLSGQRRDRGARNQRGFSLVEIVLVIGMVGILATMATYGVGKYLAMAKSAEAIQMVGAIGRAVAISADRLQAGASPQGPSPAAAPALCRDAMTVPNAFTPVRKKQYQPDPRPGVDYNTGDETTGWKCLAFENTRPQYYQYRYRLGGSPVYVPGAGSLAGTLAPDHRWAAYARGDLDGDGVFSWFILQGYIQDGQVVNATTVAIIAQDE